MNNDFTILTGMHWSAVLLYVVATVGNTMGIIFQKEQTERLAYRLVITGLIIHSSALLFWWYVVGHGPYLARYEILSAMAWGTMLTFLLFSKPFPAIRPASLLVFPAVVLMIGLGIFFNPAVKALPPTFRGIWLVLHVIFYMISLATIIIALALSLGYIQRKRTSYSWLARLPEPAAMDLLAYRFTGFGFVFWSIAMLTGAVWAYQSWGRFWGWDPIETWSLITWGGFAIYLHLRRFFGLKEEKAAALLIICFLLSMASLFFVPLFDSSIHSEYFR